MKSHVHRPHSNYLLAGSAAAILAATGFLGMSAAAPRAGAPAPTATSLAQEFDVDIVHSTLNYRLRHFNVSYFYGRINRPEGTFLLDPANPSKSHVEISAELANMDAGDENRNKFLLSPDFFNGREHPKTQFKSTAVKQIDPATWEAAGAFSLHGITKPITVRITEYTESKSAIPKFGYRAGFLCVFTIKRSDYGVDMYAKDGTLGDEVQITAAIEGAHE